MTGPIVGLDIETGGIEATRPIIQIAAVAVRGGKEVETLERKIRFRVEDADPEALRLNHYSAEAWANAVPEAQAMRDLAALLDRHRSVHLVSKRTGKPYTVARVLAHNASFDLDRVAAAFKRHGLFFAIDFRSALDTRYGAVWFFEAHPHERQPTDFKLKTLAECFGIPTEGAHDALVDVRLSIALARRLLERWQGSAA